MDVPQKQRTPQKKLYYKLPAPFTPTSFIVIVYGVEKDKRYIVIKHLASILNRKEKELVKICQSLGIFHTSESHNYGTGQVTIKNLKKLLQELKWPEENCNKGIDLLSVEKGSENRIGKKRPATRHKKQRLDDDDDDDEGDDISDEEDLDVEALAMEMAAVSGPKCVERFKMLDNGQEYKELKEECVRLRIRDKHDKDIRKTAKEEMEKRVRADLLKECEDDIRKDYIRTNAKARFEGVALHDYQMEQEKERRAAAVYKSTQNIKYF